MAEYLRKRERTSSAIASAIRQRDSTPRVPTARQQLADESPVTRRLQTLQRRVDRGRESSDRHHRHVLDTLPAQRMELEEEEPLQGRFDNGTAVSESWHPAEGDEGGLPPALRRGVENLSGVSMDDVRVHRNSSAPAAVGAHAYARGRDIHLGPSQERHLPHEAWHVVQQRQGRVRPTRSVNGMPVNDDALLEREADVMSERASSAASVERSVTDLTMDRSIANEAPLQGLAPQQRCFAKSISTPPLDTVQADVGFEFQTFRSESGFYSRKKDGKYRKDRKHLTYAKFGNKWSIENDGGDVEVVVERVAETPSGREGLEKTFTEIETFFSELKNRQSKSDTLDAQNKKKLTKVSDFSEIREKVRKKTKEGDETHEDDYSHVNRKTKITHPKKDPSLHIYITDDLNAHPQVTAGFRIEKLQEVFELLGKVASGKRTAFWAESTAKRKAKLAEELGFRDRDKGRFKQERHRRAMADPAERARWFRMPETSKAISPALQGFLTIVSSYIIAWQSKGSIKAKYAKNSTPIMSRTDLSLAFRKLLSNNDRDRYKKLVTDELAHLERQLGFPDLLERMKNKEIKIRKSKKEEIKWEFEHEGNFKKSEEMKERELNRREKTQALLEAQSILDLPLFGVGGAKDVELAKRKSVGRYTVRDFLQALANASPLSKKHADLSSTEFGSQAMGDQYEDKDVLLDPVGRGQQSGQRKGIAVELRELKGEVPIVEWRSFARAAFDLTVLINEGKDLSKKADMNSWEKEIKAYTTPPPLPARPPRRARSPSARRPIRTR